MPVRPPVLFTQAARSELIAAQDWYEARVQGLGRRFRNQVDSVVQRIAENPLQFPTVHSDVRRARVRDFLYGLFFHAAQDAMTVVACFHASRDPQEWQRRV